MSLSTVWLQTLGDGLVRADQITGIDAHQTPALTGKPSRWLFDVVLSTPIGSGTRGDWAISVLHRTLIQTSHQPVDAPETLARLLAQLDAMGTAGIISVSRDVGDAEPAPPGSVEARASEICFRFLPFATHTAAAGRA